MYKRIVIATLMGIITGLLCCWMMTQGGQHIPLKVLASVFSGRVLIGIVIGISALKLHWALHGPLMGLIVGFPGALGAMMMPNSQYGKYELFFMTLIAGIIYGFIIELVTSALFKAKQK